MAVFVSNIVIEQGFDFDTTFLLADTLTNNPLNLTGYSIESQLRKTYTSTNPSTFISSITNPTNGQIAISLGTTATSSLKEGRYVYDVKLTSNLGVVYKAVEGLALVRPGVTR